MADEVPKDKAQTAPNVYDFPNKITVADETKGYGGNGGGGNMSDIERRVGVLESDVRAIRDNVSSLLTDVAVIKSNYATKSDISGLKTDISELKNELSKDMHTQTKWLIVTIIAAIGILLAAQKLLPVPSTQLVNNPAITQSK